MLRKVVLRFSEFFSVGNSGFLRKGGCIPTSYRGKIGGNTRSLRVDAAKLNLRNEFPSRCGLFVKTNRLWYVARYSQSFGVHARESDRSA